MCDTCGCGSEHDSFTIHRVNEEEGHVQTQARHDHNHSHTHTHDHAGHHHTHEKPSGKVIEVETDILSKNNLLAERNRGFFEAKNIRVFNLVSSPGSGKTTLLEKLIEELKSSRKIYVIEGDQQTSNDARRIESAGANAIQINTGNGCHLDAHMINHAVKSLNPEENSILFIENVGNLVCPALFDLGENTRIVIASTTEGEDKPLKYPTMFRSSQVCVLNKTDLLPHLDFDVEAFRSNLRKVVPALHFIQLSAKTGDGMEQLTGYLSGYSR
ncbi:MAG: hydrogenase nickel incorporation protein HypB [Bacteroidales bacterium]|jgi:hydrogenase nickel incorporation protein HypB